MSTPMASLQSAIDGTTSALCHAALGEPARVSLNEHLAFLLAQQKMFFAKTVVLPRDENGFADFLAAQNTGARLVKEFAPTAATGSAVDLRPEDFKGSPVEADMSYDAFQKLVVEAEKAAVLRTANPHSRPWTLVPATVSAMPAVLRTAVIEVLTASDVEEGRTEPLMFSKPATMFDWSIPRGNTRRIEYYRVIGVTP